MAMLHGMSGPVLAAIALAATTPAWAQEEGTTPGALPDPSSYQGSMELQRQSDAQDQAFREQQQQATQAQQQSYQQSYQPSSQQSYEPSATPRNTGTPNQNYAPSRARPAQPGARPAQPQADTAKAAFERGDYATSARLTRLHAMEGNPIAQRNLGFLYEKGLGVPASPSLAMAWYRKAAEQGYAMAQANLGRLYFAGAGAPRDPVEGYMWLMLAGRELAAARQYMAQVRPGLTYGQTEEAMRRYQAWHPVSAAPAPQATPARARRKQAQ